MEGSQQHTCSVHSSQSPPAPAIATTAEGTQQFLLHCTLFGCYFPSQQGLFTVGAEPRMGTAVRPMPIIMPCTITGASPPAQPGQHQELDEREESLIHDLSTTLRHPLLLRGGPVPINAVLTPPEVPHPSCALPHCAEADFVFSC